MAAELQETSGSESFAPTIGTTIRAAGTGPPSGVIARIAPSCPACLIRV